MVSQLSMKRNFEVKLAALVVQYLAGGLEQDRLIMSLKERLSLEETFKEERRRCEAFY